MLRLAPAERDDIDVRRDLNALSATSSPQVGGVSIGPARHASKLLFFYRDAQRRFGIRWELLAAINEIETDYGRNLNVSTAGAVGWMQFLPTAPAEETFRLRP